VVTVVKPTVDSKVPVDSEMVLTMADSETRSVEKTVLSVVTVLTAEPSEEMVEVMVSVEMAVMMVVGEPEMVPLGTVVAEAEVESEAESDSEGAEPPAPVLRAAPAFLQYSSPHEATAAAASEPQASDEQSRMP